MYKYAGAYALIMLHEKHLREFISVWEEANNREITLPETDDADYASLDSLLFHVLRSARNYMVWICKNLELPDPEIDFPPHISEIAIRKQEYLEYLIEKWKQPLKDTDMNDLDRVFISNWGVQYSVEAMLEHAVLHPIRHAYQLKNLILAQSKG